MYGYITILNENSKLLNNAWRFVNSKKDLDEKLFYVFEFKDIDYDDLDDCCIESLESDSNYCPECGKDLDAYTINSYEKYPEKRFYTTEEFEEFFIKDNYLPADYFDAIDVNKTLQMSGELYYQIVEYLKEKGIECKY